MNEYYLIITMMLSNMLYGFLMYPNKPNASSMKPISRTNILVKTMLLISNTSVNSSGWGKKRKEKKEKKQLVHIYNIPTLVAVISTAVKPF